MATCIRGTLSSCLNGLRSTAIFPCIYVSSQGKLQHWFGISLIGYCDLKLKVLAELHTHQQKCSNSGYALCNIVTSLGGTCNGDADYPSAHTVDTILITARKFKGNLLRSVLGFYEFTDTNTYH